MSEGQIEAFIRRLKCPILFVYGTESDFMKSVRGHRAQLFPNAKIVPVEGAGHHIPHEKPEELAEDCRAVFIEWELTRSRRSKRSNRSNRFLEGST